MTVKNFKIKTLRCEWQVVIQDVDQYGRDTADREVLSSWPTVDEARADRFIHGYEDEYVKGRWRPHGAKHSYQLLDVQYREVEITS